MAFPLPKEMWGVVDVIGFRVGLAFQPGKPWLVPLCTPMTAAPLPHSPALVPVAAHLSSVLGSCSEAVWAEGGTWGKLLGFIAS